MAVIYVRKYYLKIRLENDFDNVSENITWIKSKAQVLMENGFFSAALYLS